MPAWMTICPSRSRETRWNASYVSTRRRSAAVLRLAPERARLHRPQQQRRRRLTRKAHLLFIRIAWGSLWEGEHAGAELEPRGADHEPPPESHHRTLEPYHDGAERMRVDRGR